MNINNIGTNISLMRKEKGVTQGTLAKNIGVSAQAVSKWENGGTPDIDLLPKIADFFDVPIDKLFGRVSSKYCDLQSAVRQTISKMDMAERFKFAFEICFDFERAFCGESEDKGGYVKQYQKELEENCQRYSSVLTDYGFTRMGIANKIQYFLLVPETENKELAFFDNNDYLSLFTALSDKDFFDTLIMLNKRDINKAFTVSWIIKNLDISSKKAQEIIDKLLKYNLISKTIIEADDTQQEIFNFIPSPSFIALLIFAREMLETNWNFTWYWGGRSKPYLK